MKAPMHGWSVLLLIATVGSASGCDEGPTPLRIWAAASLSDVVPELSLAFARTESEPGPIEHSFDASNRLARQIEEGAPADVFLSADLEWIAYLEERGAIAADGDWAFATNALVVVVPAGAAAPATLGALVEDVDQLALAGEGVPAGRYAHAALQHSGLLDVATPKIVRGGSVRTVLSWVADGEVDAGIVYRTDALSEPRVEVAIETVAGAAPTCGAAVCRHAASASRAARYVEFLRADGADVLRRHGFTP